MSYQDELRRWASRRRTIIEHYGQTRSLAATAAAFGISRERVRQIVSMGKKNKRGQDRAEGSD